MNSKKSAFSRTIDVALREFRRMASNRIYLLAMFVFPIVVMLLFTTLMGQGQPLELPIGVVDHDNTSTTRQIVRLLDSFQGSRVAGHYDSEAEAREAIQRGDIYGFLLFPDRLTADLTAGRQPKVSYYYSNTSITAGSLLYRDLKTATTLLAAAAGQSKLMAKGLTTDQIQTLLQPIKVDLHPIANPWINYNFYLSVMMVPGCLLVFVFLVTAYCFGVEVKDSTAEEWFEVAGRSPIVAVVGKALPLVLVYSLMLIAFFFYAYGVLGFPCLGSVWTMVWLCVLVIMASVGFGVIAFEMIPSLRMSMSICSLWAVLSFSMVGTAFPVFAMDSVLQALAWMFPLRHFFVVYASSVFNGFPVVYSWANVVVLVVFACLPLLGLWRINSIVEKDVYME